MNKKIFHIIISLIIFVPLFITAVTLSPPKVDAINIFSPFGGRVKSWKPNAPGCSAITRAISLATMGTVNPTIEQLVVKGSAGGTFGILRLNGAIVPGLTKIYSHKKYQLPGNYVVGNYLDLCGGSVIESIGGGDVIENVIDGACDITASSCPINKLVHKMGTSLLPSL